MKTKKRVVLTLISTLLLFGLLTGCGLLGAGPRDGNGQPGAYEAALEDNHTLHDVKQPVEILRTIHSFDPCIACAVHLTDPDGEEIIKVKVK